MSAIHKIITSVASAAVLASGLAVATAGPASAATCPSEAAPLIDGATAEWKLRCSGNNVTVQGWLQDTRTDGKCAVVRINAGNGDYKTKSACSSGVREQFSFTFAGTRSAQVRLAVA
ncbi:hypothetical protein [Actinacidiphila sp. bgisy167]|uniref:hypothetical protein n=1 Tax=Actinacidiphila sp. bgisy167 TaxID=3413797 RepID=UPI003D72923D